MALNFSDVLSRADTALLQHIIGPPVVRLLGALEPEKARPSSLRSILLELHPPAELLLSRATRVRLLELLRPQEADALREHLGLPVRGNVFSSLTSLEVPRRSSLSTLLLSHFGLVEPEADAEASTAGSEVAGGYELFPHQRVAALRVAAMLAQDPRRALLHMPTGSGKTRTAMSLVADHLRGADAGVVLWLAAAEELCGQAAEEFVQAWSRLGDRRVRVHRWWGSDKIKGSAPCDGFAVAGLAKLYAVAVDDPTWLARLGDRVTLIVFDEAHQAIAPTFQHVVEAVSARRERTALLGLSATPGRTWNDPAEDEKLSAFFGRRKVTLEIAGSDNPVDALIRDGYLARPSYRLIDHHGPELSDDEREAIGSQLEIPRAVLQRLADDHLRNLHIAREARRLASNHRRFIVFATTVEHAEMLAVVLRLQGIAARAVSSRTTTAERAEAIRWYRQGAADETRVLTNFGVLTTGFDAPRTSAVLIARPTRSLVLYSQMVGRAIRGEQAGGNRTAEVVTVVDTGLPGFRSLSESFSNWEDVWRS